MYIEKIKELSLNNKYTDWYCSIVRRGILRVSEYKKHSNKKRKAKELFGYVESHHIVPRSLDASIIKDIDNLVFLTAKEHFICHLLLVKMLKSTFHVKKMEYAISRLSRKFKNNSVNYSRMKNKFSKNHSDLCKQLMSDPEYKEMCVRPMIDAHKNIDHSSDEWISRSFGSESAREKSKISSQSLESRERARERELSKGQDALSQKGKERQQVQYLNAIKKFGSDEAYRQHCSDRIKGRIKIINIQTLEMKVVRDNDGFDSDWVVFKNLPKEKKTEYISKRKELLPIK